MRAATAGDLICRQCHQQWFVDNADAALTHPIVADYAARAAAANAAALAAGEPQDRYKVAPDNSLAAGANGDIRLVSNGTTNGVACTSCHGVHFTDSDSMSADTRENYNTADLAFFSRGDGKLLRTDGATRANKSALCQACHNYRPHGDSGTKHSITGTAGVTATTTVGCLECHSGHSYNNGNVQFYVLRPQIGAPYNVAFTAPYNYSVKPASHDQAIPWQDGAGSNGYCEKCHGDVALLGGSQHTNTAKCLTCHFHNSAPAGYSFEPGANVAICGDCHGFPPHVNARGDRTTLPSYEGGYAYVAAANNYSLASNFKDESQTPHNAHAAAGVVYSAEYLAKAGLPTGIDSDYRMGDGEVACSTCHGVRPNHNTGTTAVMGSYENLEFDSRAAVDGQAAPAYAGAGRETCNNVYCHSNGGRRVGDNPTETTRVWSFIETPYVGATSSGWKGAKASLIAGFGNATECATCHGNSSATMTSRGNSAVHNKHLNKGYTCNVCHVYTATNNISVPKAARDVSKNAGDPTKGTHVNQKVDVNFDPTVTPAIGGTYSTSTGTCTIYCHSDGKGNLYSADWDVTASGACNTCHLTTTLTSGSHARHISAATGPLLSCDKCHGTNATLGTHTGHVDGSVTVTANVCTTCHAVDGAETIPVWGNPSTTDCKTCHTGASITAAGQIGASAAPAKAVALTAGHGKASGSYAVTGKNAANRDCVACHTTTIAGHFDGVPGDDKLLTGGFTCTSCHNGTTATAVKSHDNTDPTYTNQKRADFSLQCETCHDPHGSSNIAMVAPSKSGYNGTAVFSAFTGTNSFDESDSGAGANNDDICATCHSTTAHNNRTVAGTHHEGELCTSCHGHNGTLGGFMPTGGNACNDCHGNPPATGAHAKHVTVTIHDQTEDRTDCDKCHTGASTYTYNAGGNHQNSAVDLAAGIAGGTTGCTSACHTSTVSDGFWTDATGLSCDSCHYYTASPTSAGNTAAGAKALGALSHNKHFDKSKVCSDCHAIENGGAVMVGPLTHISDVSGANEGAKFTGMGQALQDEAAVVRAGMTFDDNLNTCSGGIALGCHATGTPDWDVAIPANGCTQCHTDTTTTTVNPASGLHGITPSVSGKIHDQTINGSGCAACHTTLAAQATHVDGTLQGGNGQKTQMGLPAWYTQTADNTGTCATTACHLTVSDPWAHVWTNTASYYTNSTTACGGCHGLWANWTAGVTNHRTGSEAETVHGTGATYKCRDCHGLESASGYPFTFGSNDWKNVEAGTTLHGDGQIQVNTAGTTGYSRGATYGGCTGCHTATDGAAVGQHAFTKTAWTLATITSDAISTSCSSCHGGATVGVSKSNYWPDGANTLGDNATADNSGEHAVHVAKLALKVYGETATGAADNDILRDATTLNPGLSSDAKQKELCSYCHTTPGADGDHGVTYPADVNTMYTLWSKTLDNGALTPATGSCATVDCHNNVTTTAGYYWYAGGTSACAMCHTTGAADATHVAHTGGGYGKTIDCLSCHGAGTTTTTAPTAGHINGAFAVAGNVTFTYGGGLTGTCGTNACHNDGNGGTPYSSGAALGAYNWATPLTNCTACHNNPNATGNAGARHSKHMANATYVPGGCSECHPAATVATHIDGSKNATGAKQSVYTGANGTCTNTCHTATVANGVWTDALALPCVNCHQAGSYVGSGANMPTSGLHAVTVALKHDGTLQSGNCINCHASIPTTVATNHINGTLQNATAVTYAWNANVVSYVPASGCQAAIACHTDGGDWKRKWTGVIDLKPTSGNPGDTVCGNCHGDTTLGWRWNEANGTTTDHTDPNGNATDNVTPTHGGCQNCHGWGAAGYDKTWLTGKHGDGFITMNGPSPTTGAAYDNVTGGCAQACHANTATYQLNTSSGWTANYGDYGAGSCYSCHGNGTNQYWPDGSSYPDKAGRHTIHITKLAAKLAITLPGTDLEQKRMCEYCHNDATGVGGSSHMTNSGDSIADVGGFNPLWSAGNPPSTADAGSGFTLVDGSCSSIDCHNNKTLPAGTFGWRDASTTTCTMCHTPGGGASDPASGLHNLTPTVSGQRHDQTVTGGCTACHSSLPAMAPASTHINGAFTGNGTVAGDKTNMGLFAAYTATADGVGSCAGGTTGNAGCHAGAGDAGSWARKWDSSISGLSNGTECKGCHGGFTGTDWTFGATHNTSDNNVEHNYSWDGDGSVEIVGNHKDNLGNTSRCNVCHVYGDAGYVFGTNHRNGQLEMNSTRGYSNVSWNCTSTCHVSNTLHNLEASGWTLNPVAGPALACDSCHGGSGQYWPNNPATAVGSYPNRKGRHDIHMTRLAAKLGYTLPGSDAQQKAMCDYCHNDASGSGGSGHDDRVAPANQGGFNHIGTAAVDANGAYNSTAPGTCTTVDCHNNQLTASGTYGWYDSGSSSCLMCHSLGGTNGPTSGLHNVNPTVSGAANRHDDSFSTGGTCTSCHTAIPTAGPTTHVNGTFTGNGTIAGDKTNMGLFASYTATADNIGTCSGGLVGGGSCHAGTGDAGTWARVWNSAVSGQTNGTECKGCHGGFAATDWTFGATHNTGDTTTEHQYNWDGDANTSEVIGSHKDNAANTTRCNICHVYADAPYTTGAFATYHRDGKITMNSSVEYVPASLNCTGACHVSNVNHNLDASGWTVQTVAGPTPACSSCHGGGTSQGGGLFNYWPDGASYPDISGRHTIHVTRLAAKLGYTLGALTDAQQKTMCGYCHNDAAGVGGTGHNDSVSPANTGSFKHIGTGAADGGTAGTIAAGVCSNVDCHNNKATSGGYTWTGAGTSTCLMCHTKGGVTNDPSSGLHNVVPTITGQTHDDSFATGGTCISCHTTLPAMSAASTHINGTFTGNGTIAGDKTNMGLFTAYTATADNIGTCSGAAVGGASCHVNIMDAGSWARKWDASIPGQTNGTECQGCHGGMSGTDWTFGGGAHNTTDYNVEHNYSWDGDGSNEIIGNHKDSASNATKCNICHVYADAPYTTGAFATYHRNGKITMNSATTYSGTTWNCTAVCHVSNTNHNLEASASAVWATRGETVAGPSLACYTCHGGGTANSGSGFNYWPDGTTYPDTAGGSGTNRHLAHITKLAAKLGYTMATLTDQQQKTMCAYCHPYTTSPGEAGHNDNVAPADVTAAAFNPLWSTITTNYPSTADGGTAASWVTGTQQCSGIDCHNNQATTGTFAWNSTATSSCLLCHNLTGAGNNPSSGLHYVVPNTSGALGTHDDSFGSGGTCTSCHTTLPAVGPSSTHMNSTFTANSTIAGDKTAMGLFTAYTQTANDIGTCSGAGVASAGCHGDGVAAAQKGDAGTWKRVWDRVNVNSLSNGTECKGCHGGLGGTDWTFGVTSGAANTGDTSTDHMASYDGDGTSNEIAGNHSGTTQTTRCVNCHVYGEGAYVWATNHRNNAVEVNSALGMTTVNRTCTSYCHTNNTGHVLDAGGWTVATLAGSPLTCSTCHAITTHTDANGDGSADACTSCHTDHNISPANDRTGVNAANNVYISTISARTVVGGYGNDTGTPIPTMNNQYATHDSWIQLGGTAITWGKSTEAETCWACHDAVTTSRKMLTGVNVTFTSPATIAATGIDTKFNVGDWITITGSSNAANNRTFKVAAKAAGSLTITNQTGDATLTSVAAAAGVVIVSPLSEWQVNETPDTGTLGYDYGELYTDTTTRIGVRTSNWTTGSWRSGKGRIGGTAGDGAYNPYWYKRGAIQSTHSANYGGTYTAAITAGNSLGYNRTESVDAVANIRCAYCHDVHGTHDGVNGDVVGSSTGPFLRGAWKGNNYSEDGAPQWGMNSFQVQGSGTVTPAGSSSAAASYGVVPRGSAGTANSGSTLVAKVGGYWIDQNSASPNAGSSATATAGLCDQCHGATKDGTWAAAEIGAIDQVTGENLWVSGTAYNGHGNAVINGSGGNGATAPAAASAEIRARNIFTRTLRGWATMSTAQGSPKIDMNMGAVGAVSGYTFREGTGTSGYDMYPRVYTTSISAAGTQRPYAFNYFAWNGGTGKTSASTGTALTQAGSGAEAAHDAQLNFHQFTCAKCHNPHASRLPKLMLTNCLDTNHNTWDNFNFTAGAALPTPFTGTLHSQWSTAQNCHRLDARASLASGQVTTLGTGWNKATPWLESTTPNTVTGTNPNP